MSIELLTPLGAALGALVALPLAALAAAGRRAARARRALGLSDPGPPGAGPALAIVICSALLALAASQPVVIREDSVETRTDAEAIVVVDSSRSMLAAAGPGNDTRFDRAREAARRLAEALPQVPLGLASMTDRVLPHSFPTPRRSVFLAALDRVLGVERPPPRGRETQVTSLGALDQVPGGELFSPDSERRLLFVLTDGESRPFDEAGLARALADAGIEAVLVHVWQPGEAVFAPGGRPEAAYLPDTASPQVVDGLGSLVGGAFGEDRLDDAVQAARDHLGSGPLASVGHQVGATHLAPWAVLAALVPLGFLLWRRNLT